MNRKNATDSSCILNENSYNKPHPRKELLEYQVEQVLETLEREDLI